MLDRIAAGGKADFDLAVKFALPAQKAWAATPVAERCQAVKKWGELIKANADDLALLLALECGKTYKSAQGEIAYAASFLDYYADNGEKMLQEEVIQTPTAAKPTRITIKKDPVGLAASPLPWNFPVAMGTRKVGPALVAGCAMIIKPSELTPFATNALAVLANEAGLPPGVFSIVNGEAPALGTAMATHPDIRKITFTGSTRVGSLLLQQAAPQIKNMTMELGGNAPFIVYDDADIELCLQAVITSKFYNCGQACVASNRFFVQKSIYDSFVEKLVEKVSALRVGYSLDPNADLSSLVNAAAAHKMEDFVKDATEKGAKLLTGGKRLTITSQHGESDLFFAPTVLSDCTADMKCMQDEIFGPVIAITSFETDDEALTRANSVDAGLAAYLFTTNPEREAHAVNTLEYGMVAVNQGSVSTAIAPFGGMKHSGIGREGSEYGLSSYYELKAVHKHEKV